MTVKRYQAAARFSVGAFYQPEAEIIPLRQNSPRKAGGAAESP